MNPKNPFEDPEYPIDDNVRGKDVKPPKPKKIEKKTVPKATQSSGLEFSVKEFDDYYRIGGVKAPYHSDTDIFTVDLAKKLLDGGAEKTQDEWVDYSKEAVKKNDFLLGSMPLYHSIFRKLYLNRNSKDAKLVEKIRSNIHEIFAIKNDTITEICTLSRVVQGDVYHDVLYGLDSSFKIQWHPRHRMQEVFGIKEEKNPDAYNPILGSMNPEEIQAVYEWIVGHDNIHIYPATHSIDDNPASDFEVTMYEDEREFVIDAGHLGIHDKKKTKALGVRIHEKGLEDTAKIPRFNESTF